MRRRHALFLLALSRCPAGSAHPMPTVGDLIFIRALHPGLFLQDPAATWANDVPLETAMNRSGPMACGHTWTTPASLSGLVGSISGSPVGVLGPA
jgi:hypothetical protein